MDARTTSGLVMPGCLCVTLALCGQAIAGEGEAKASKSDVVVREISLDLPQDVGEIRQTLWDRFLRKPNEEEIDSLSPADWRASFAEYRQSLVKKAKSESLDYRSLDKCLAAVLKDVDDTRRESPRQPEIAHVPVAAYLAKQGHHPVWIVVLRWEIAHTVDLNTGEVVRLGLSHVCAYAFRVPSLRQIGFMTCD